MSKCLNCIHNGVCAELIAHAKHQSVELVKEILNLTPTCDHYKDKSLCVELPCEVGKPVFFFVDDGVKSELFNGKVFSIIYEQNQIWIYCSYENGLTFHHTIDDIGKKLFFNKEDVERKLKEFK